MERIEYTGIIDKTDWQRGEWDNEADKIQWQDEATRLPCLIVRGPVGALCGYVGVLPGHPFYGLDYSSCRYGEACPEKKGDDTYSYCDHRPESFLNAHGGITFSGGCATVTREKWTRWREKMFSRCDEAKRYPHGDSARAFKEWAGCLDNYEEWVKRAHGRFIIRQPADGEPDCVWWFGFDCAHCGDLCPSMSSHGIRAMSGKDGETYKDIAYVTAECAGLAKQLIALTPTERDGG